MSFHCSFSFPFLIDLRLLNYETTATDYERTHIYVDKASSQKKIKKVKARVHTPHSFIHKKEDKDGNYKQVRVQKEEFTNLGLSYLYPTHMLTLHNKKNRNQNTNKEETTRVPLFCYYNEPSSYNPVKGKEEDGNDAATITRAANNMGRKVPRRPEEAMGALRRGDS